MTIFRDLSILVLLSNTIAMFLLVFESKYSRRVTAIATAIFSAVIIVANMLLLFAVDVNRLSQLFPLTFTLPYFMYLFIMSRYKNARFLFTFFSVGIASSCITVITGLIPPLPGDWHYVLFLVSRVVLCLGADAFILARFRRDFLRAQRMLKKGWLPMSLVALLSFLLLVYICAFPVNIRQRPDDIPSVVLMLVLMPLIYYTMMYTIIQQLHTVEEANIASLLSIQNETLYAQIVTQQTAESQMRIWRHDARHHTRQLISLLSEGDTGLAMRMLEKMEHSYEEVPVTRYCENNVVNATLSYYLGHAKKNGIAVDTRLTIPEKTQVDAFALSTVLANSIENAHHACEPLDAEEKRISVSCVATEGLLLEISNPYRGEIRFDADGLPIPPDGRVGVGTRSIVTFAEKNNGLWSFKASGGVFVLRLVVPAREGR